MRYEDIENLSDDPVELAAFIKKNCKLYLEENPSLKPLFRGTKRSYSHVMVKNVKQDRDPVDTPKELDNVINSALKEMGSVATRSNSIFVSGDRLQAEDYGKVYVVFPMGEYHYAWSPTVIDLYDLLFSQSKKYGLQSINEVELDHALEEYKFMVLYPRITNKIQKKLEDEYTEKYFGATVPKDEYERNLDAGIDVNELAYKEAIKISERQEFFEKIDTIIEKLRANIIKLFNSSDPKDHEKLNKVLEIHPVSLSSHMANISHEKLKDFIKKNYFINERLEDAIDEWREIIIHCKQYLSIETNLYKAVEEELKRELLGEAVGRIVKGVNTTKDVGPDAIKVQAKKFGFNVTKDGVPPTIRADGKLG